jgi:hypothetical protein
VKVCPTDSSHTEFITAAVEHHDWVVDGNGDLIEDLGCAETVVDTEELICRTCSTQAEEIQ